MKILVLSLTVFVTGFLYCQTPGCTDPLASNYNVEASINDGTCVYENSSVSATSSVELPEIMVETSGLIFWQNELWTHNDNADINLYSFNPASPVNYEMYELTGTTNIDQEEISQDSNYIYLGDFGNNVSGNRTNLYILRIEKLSLLAGSPIIDTIFFSYSNQSDFNPTEANETDFDCESFIVSTDSIYLFTKQWVSEKTALYSLSKYPGVHVANYKAELDVSGLITGAYHNRSKKLVVLSGYSSYVQPFFYLLYDFSGNDFFSGNKRKISFSSSFHQVEGVTSNDNLTYYATNEKLVKIITIKQKLHEIDLSTYLNSHLSSIIEDLNSPEILSSHLDTVFYVDNNCSIIMPDFTADIQATDDITSPENLIFTQTPYCGQLLNKGVYDVKLRAYDEYDNFHEVSFSLEVLDTIAPTVEYGSLSITLEAIDDCSAPIPDLSEVLNVFDNCSDFSDLTIEQNPIPGTIVSGSEDVCSLNVFDVSGNSVSYEFEIIITDTTVPNIQCPVLDSITLSYGEESYIVEGMEFDLLVMDDNCEITEITNDFNNEESLIAAEFFPGTTTVVWTVRDENDNLCECEFDVNVAITSVDFEQLAKISIFPNPVSDKLIILDPENEINQVKVIDINGKEIDVTLENDNAELTYDVSHLERGIYFVIFKTNRNTLKYKFIKN